MGQSEINDEKERHFPAQGVPFDHHHHDQSIEGPRITTLKPHLGLLCSPQCFLYGINDQGKNKHPETVLDYCACNFAPPASFVF